MADMYPVAGSRIYIGGTATAKEDMVESDFSGQVWTEIDGWSTAGAIGDTSTAITVSMINRKRDVTMKGTRAADAFDNTFVFLPDDPGQQKLFAADADDCHDYAFKVEVGTGCEDSATVTISNGSPGVVSWPTHGLQNGDRVKFTTTGSLPTGLTPNTSYYVVSATSGQFSVAATLGGAPIATSTTGSGTHTATTESETPIRYFVGPVMSASEQGGEANTGRLLNVSIARNSNLVKVNG